MGYGCLPLESRRTANQQTILRYTNSCNTRSTPLRIAGIDYGQARIGIAISDAQQMVTRGIATIPNRRHRQQTLVAIAQALSPYLPLAQLVIGLPLHLDGTKSALSKEVETFAADLAAKLQLAVTLQDERLTSVQAERLLKEARFSRQQRACRSDRVAACLILQSFLDQQQAGAAQEQWTPVA